MLATSTADEFFVIRNTNNSMTHMTKTNHISSVFIHMNCNQILKEKILCVNTLENGMKHLETETPIVVWNEEEVFVTSNFIDGMAIPC